MHLQRFLWYLVFSIGLTACHKDPAVPSGSKSSAKAILKFSFSGLSPAVDGTITGTAITATVPAGTDLTKLVPTLAISDKATVNPTSGVVQDFTKSVTYTVTAEDGSTQVYAVSAVKEKGGTVYIGSLDGICYAIDATTGAKKWEFKTGDGITATATVVDGIVYFASWDKKIYALDAESGVKKWESNPAVVKLIQPFAAPLVQNGMLYYGGDNYFYALDATTGIKKWEFRDDDVYGWQASPTIYNGIVYASIRGAGSRVGIYGLDALTGARKWKAEKTLVTESSPAIAENLLYAGSEYDGFNAFNLQTGATVWSAKTGTISKSSPTVSNGIVYINAYTGGLWDIGNDYLLLAFDAKTGAKKWEFKMVDAGLAYDSSPLVANGIVYTCGGNTLYAVDAATGAKKWSAKSEDANTIQSGPVVAMGLVYQGIGKKVYAFEAATGAKKWEFETSRGVDQSSPCVVAKDGTVYHAGISGMVQ